MTEQSKPHTKVQSGQQIIIFLPIIAPCGAAMIAGQNMHSRFHFHTWKIETPFLMRCSFVCLYQGYMISISGNYIQVPTSNKGIGPVDISGVS